MSNWNLDNRASKALWAALHSMDQLSGSFADSETLKIGQLTFYNNLSGGNLIRKEAEMIADMLDNIFIKRKRAQYEAGIDRTQALNDIVKILIDADKILSQLGETIDASYLFRDEQE